jgi:hypothetical protein
MFCGDTFLINFNYKVVMITFVMSLTFIQPVGIYILAHFFYEKCEY